MDSVKNMQNLCSLIPQGGRRSILLLIAALALLSGCSGPGLTDYAERGPKLIPEQFFSGELTARGVVKDISGKSFAPLMRISLRPGTAPEWALWTKSSALMMAKCKPVSGL